MVHPNAVIYGQCETDPKTIARLRLHYQSVHVAPKDWRYMCKGCQRRFPNEEEAEQHCKTARFCTNHKAEVRRVNKAKRDPEYWSPEDAKWLVQTSTNKEDHKPAQNAAERGPPPPPMPRPLAAPESNPLDPSARRGQRHSFKNLGRGANYWKKRDKAARNSAWMIQNLG
ncbi:hypothetical protein T439DRAFT_33985 [Meredithblackwellia eburnea MCA 4105]